MDRLLLLDWDSTIVDQQGTITTPRLAFVLREKMQQGWSIGLSSDTPLRRLATWAESLHLNGPLIAEKGAVVWVPYDQKTMLSPVAPIYTHLRKRFIESITHTRECALFFGDSTNFINSVQNFRTTDEALIALDAYRLCSLGLFGRKIINGDVTIDQEFLKATFDILLSLLPPDHAFAEHDLNFDVGFIGIHSATTSKTQGTQTLISHIGQPQHIIMLGDSMSDYIDLPCVTHFAVGNATPEFKALADKVATQSYAEGCVELLLS